MARIRSIHPGLFTDEAFVELSDGAQILFVGLLTEADDEGVFDWKPTTLRMRLRQNKDGSIEPLLSELEAHHFIKRWEVDGRQLGALRNFRRFQHPKFPKGQHTINDDIRNYVGLSLSITEMAPDDEPPLPHGEERRGEEEGEERIRKKKKGGGADAPTGFRFSGDVIKLAAKDFERWRKAYSAIPDLAAELTKADAFYREKPPPDGKWFFKVSSWLERANKEALERKKPNPNGRGSLMEGIF